MNNIIIDMEHPKKFWEQFPIEIILEEERKRKKRYEQREQLQIPLPPSPSIDKEIENDDYIIIQFSSK